MSAPLAEVSRGGSRSDTGRVGTRVTSSRLIGRAGELAECEAALREAADGRPSVIALSGESGVGKTRLIAEFEDSIVPDARILHGECVDLSEGELPYAPLVGALRDIVRCADPVFDSLSVEARAALGALLPSLGDGTSEDRDDEFAQLRLFEALLELLERLGEQRPVVLVIEDLHWADRSTRTFTAFLCRSLRRERVLFLFSYRDDELHRRHPLLPLLRELEHGERLRRLSLSPWGRTELEEALTDILGAAPSTEISARLFERAQGNPLYTEELLAAGLDGRGAAPQSLRDAFLLRFDRLSSEAQQTLRVLAVARHADEELLTAASGLNAAQLNAALRETIDANVIAADALGVFAFRHALLGEVAYEDLLPGERASLHLGVAAVLQQRSTGNEHDDAAVAAQIAAHARAAGDQPLALRTSIAAAGAASNIHAHGEAAELLERALQGWAHVPDAEAVAGIDHVELLLRAAAEHDYDERRARAEAMLQSALEELDEDTEPVRAAIALELLSRAQWGLAKGDEALAAARGSLGALAGQEAPAERASALAWLARITLLRGRYGEAVPAAEEALALVRASNAGPRLETQVLNTLGMALSGSGEIFPGVEALRAALELAQDSRDSTGEAYAHTNLSDVLLSTGDTHGALAVALEGVKRVPPNLRGSRVWLAATVAECAFASGDWSLACDSLDEELHALEGRWLINIGLRRAELALGIGETERAGLALERIAPLVDRTIEPQFLAAYGLARAELERRAGSLEAARDALELALDRIETCTDDARRVTAIGAAGLAVEAQIAQRARDRGEDDALRDATLRGEIHLARVQAGAETSGPVEAVWLVTAEAENQRMLGTDTPEAWANAALAWEAIDRPYLAARLRLREAEAHIGRGDRASAADVVAGARTAAERLGARWLVEELDGLAARARLPRPATERARSKAPDDPFGLTRRELEVLLLVEQGQTNREIGERLFMAEKTASVHVSRILTKLGVKTRTQAAAVAHRAGLIHADELTWEPQGHPRAS